MNNKSNSAIDGIICFHCGDVCSNDSIKIDDKYFCCSGCKLVYEILEEKNLCNYYSIESNPGINRQTPVAKNKFEYLDDENITARLLDFNEGSYSKVTFFVPQMHCSSCIWLLENLYKLEPGIIESKVNFLKKEISVSFKKAETTLRKVVELLSSLGYEPGISLENLERKIKNNENKNIYYKLGITGFVFANIMLLSFPEYLSINPSDIQLKRFFSYINIFLSLPVFFYCSSGYFTSAYKSLKKGVVNIDFPLSIGIMTLYFRSLFEILTYTGVGYLDSFAGLVFLLLLGKLFQTKTYDTLNFERNYKSYFPISVTVKKGLTEKVIPLSKLTVGERIVVRNGELIPADSILFAGEGNIDYSFVTGESSPIVKVMGETIYAGGKHFGKAIELEVIKKVSQSYLTQLWNNSFTKKEENKLTTISNNVSKYFTFAVLFIATASFLFWLPQNFNSAVNAFTSVLIIACPCALAMSTPFTLGNSLRIFGKNGFYLKNTNVIEVLSKINSVVFDKTGTITQPGKSTINFNGEDLSLLQLSMVKSIVRNSLHPLSSKIYNYIDEVELSDVSGYNEIIGSGIEGRVKNSFIKLGSLEFVTGKTERQNNIEVNEKSKKISSRVYLSIDGVKCGYFEITNFYREGLNKILFDLKNKLSFSLLSGDNDSEKEILKNIFPESTKIYFNQTPSDKLRFIKELQQQNKSVLMVGDGLNDAGALLQSDAGISISEDISNFSPACDAILDSGSFNKLSDFINFSKISVFIIKFNFVISFLYNLVGLSIAVQGKLSPLFAAILMPLSSISVVVFSTLSTNIIAKRKGLN